MYRTVGTLGLDILSSTEKNKGTLKEQWALPSLQMHIICGWYTLQYSGWKVGGLSVSAQKLPNSQAYHNIVILLQ